MTPATSILNSSPLEGAEMPCHVCGTLVAIPDTIILEFARRHGIVCDRCADKHAEMASRAARSKKGSAMVERWLELCPDEFRNTLPHKLPRPTLLQKVLDWKYGKKGLLLHGETGLGKSRCAWKLIEREFMLGRKIRVLDSRLQFQYPSLFGDGGEKIEAWGNQMIEAELLLLDDVFKAKLTDSLEGALYAVVSARTENSKPIICTLNDTGDTLVARMSGDRGPAMVRRLRGNLSEFADVIDFGK